MAAETALPGDDFCLEDDPVDSAGDRMAARLHPGIEVRPPLSRIPSKSYAHVKRAFDIVFSALGLVALSPVLAACAVAVKATSQGPVLFKQKRWGRAGSRFECWKFRTMLVETPPDMPAQDFADKAAFMTPVGNFLRRWSLDGSRSSRTSSRATCRSSGHAPSSSASAGS